MLFSPYPPTVDVSLEGERVNIQGEEGVGCECEDNAAICSSGHDHTSRPILVLLVDSFPSEPFNATGSPVLQ